MTTQLSEGLLREAFTTLRRHGDGHDECVVFLAGPQAVEGSVDELLHPEHTAHPGFYEVEQRWLHNTCLELARRQRTIRMQIHTHKFAAFHSVIDDTFPVDNTPGLLSLVIPEYAMGPIGLERSYLTRLEADGSWRELDGIEELVLQ